MIIANDSCRIYILEMITRRSKMGKTVVIDTDECIGCESCVELCSEVFTFNEEEEKAEVIMPEGGPEDCIEEAMETCPVECIHWEED
jgi:ferredoxin